jgi:hypothetical protein
LISVGITEVTALIGAITGSLGLLLGILTYFRDRSLLIVTVDLDMRVHNAPQYNSELSHIVIYVSNAGRRPEYVTLVGVLFPDGRNAIVNDVFHNPNEVVEGGPPRQYMSEQRLLQDFDDLWPGTLFFVRTASGRQYRAPFLRVGPKSGKKINWFLRWMMRLQTSAKFPWAFKSNFRG